MISERPPIYRIEQNQFHRWIIVNTRDPELAWSGSCWVEHTDGLSRGRTHVSTFTSEEEARQHAREVWGE
jgi:hypothetical protein